jgi:hypothetical protein
LVNIQALDIGLGAENLANPPRRAMAPRVHTRGVPNGMKEEGCMNSKRKSKKQQHVTGAFLIAVAGSIALAAGCGQRDEERTSHQAEALSSNAAAILGFEVPSDWHVTSGQTIPLTSSATASQGAASLSVAAQNYVSIQSATFSVSSAITGPVSYDLLLPPPANPSWAGTTQLYMDCHSLAIYNQYLGQTELTGIAAGQFTTMSYPLPAATLATLAHGCTNLSFTVVLNVPSNSTGSYLIDNLQLDGPPVVGTCSLTPATATDAGVSPPTTTFASTLVRPDVGTFALASIISEGDPSTLSNNFTLNGNPLYQVQQQISNTGAFTRSDTYFAPITGVHQIVSTSDGTTFTMVVDGRQTVPLAAVGANPATASFVDGRPAPQLDIPVAVADAFQELLNNAAAVLPTCAIPPASPTSPTSPPLIADVGTDDGHASGDSASGCNSCDDGCLETLAKCTAEAIITPNCPVSTGIFGGLLDDVIGFACGAYDAYECSTGLLSCQRTCSKAGTACCPVDCGGAGNITPIGLCCLSGESCLKRGSTGHVAICCSAGQTPCGGSECCGSDTTCLPTGTGTSACCAPSQINAQGTCCPNGISTNGQCCGVFGSCRTEADCASGLEGACVAGCCTLG